MAALDGDGVSLQVQGRVATLVLDPPNRRNAMQLRTWLALPGLIAAAEGLPEVGVILVRGAGRHFGAGNDIAEFGALRSDAAAATAYGQAMAQAMRAVEAASTPVVMAIEGVCYGASVALALAGDLRLAADDAVLATTPARLGALYLHSDLQRLAAAVGVSRAKRLIYCAEPVGAAEALDMGLVDEVLAADRFEPELARRIDVILQGSPFTLRRTKAALRSLGHGCAPPETAESLASFVEATQGEDFKEGVEAFLNRRPPRFR